MAQDVVSWRNNLLANPHPPYASHSGSLASDPCAWHQNPLAHADQQADQGLGYPPSPGNYSSPVYTEPAETISSGLDYAPHIKYQTPYENFIFHVTYVVATNFGFQLFNRNPNVKAGVASHQLPYVPAVVFIAADHLCTALLDDLTTRRCIMGKVPVELGFKEAVWMLHGKVFATYTTWAETAVKLPVRPSGDDELLWRDYNDEEVVKLLAAELSLYFLLYSEGANLRHTPDLLAFIYWAARFSPAFSQCRAATLPLARFTSNDDPSSNLRELYVLARNHYAPLVDSMRQELLTAQGEELHPNSRHEISREIQDLKPIIMEELLIEPEAQEADIQTLSILADLIAFGDGGAFTDLIIQPLFHLLAYLEDKLGGEGHDTSTRLTYDDCNDCMTSPHIVRAALAKLGAEPAAEANAAFASLMGLGAMPEGGVDFRVAAQWWETEVFRKVFVERRGWLHLYRNYPSAFALSFMSFQVVAVATFVGVRVTDPRPCQPRLPKGKQMCNPMLDDPSCGFCINLPLAVWSSLIATHICLKALQRWASWWLSRQPAVAPTLAHYEATNPSKIHTIYHPITATYGPNPNPPSSTTPRRPPRLPFLPTEGHVRWAAIHWIIPAALAVILYLLQFNPSPVGFAAHYLWLILAACYAALALLAFFLATKDGYKRSLWESFMDFIRCDQRPQLAAQLPRNWLAIGWKSWGRNAALWAVTLVVGLFATYMAAYRQLFWVASWIMQGWTTNERGSWHIGGYNTGMPVPGKELLGAAAVVFTAALTSIPLMLFVNFVIGTQVLAFWVGRRHGYGTGKTWAEFCRGFPEMAGLWCSKCMPPAMGSTAVMSELTKVGKKKDRARLALMEMERDAIFATVWNTIVQDLHTRDLLSRREALQQAFAVIEDPLMDPLRLPQFYTPPFVSGPAISEALKLSAEEGPGSREAPAGKATGLPTAGSTTSAYGSEAARYYGLVVWTLVKVGVLPPRDGALLVERAQLTYLREHWEHIKDVILSSRTWVDAVAANLPSIADAEAVSIDAKGRAKIIGLGGPAFAAVAVTAGLRDTAPLKDQAADGASEVSGSSYSSGMSKPLGNDKLVVAGLLRVVQALERHADMLRRQSVSRAGEAHSEAQPAFERLQYARQRLQSSPTDRVLSRVSLLTSADRHWVMALRHLAITARTCSHSDSKPGSDEAEKLLRFFLKSMHNPALGKQSPCPIVCMPSFTTVVPWYNEDVLHPLNERQAAAEMGVGLDLTVEEVTTRDTNRVWIGLTTPIEGCVSQISYLQRMYAEDWRHFQERISGEAGLPAASVTAEAFQKGGPLEDLQLEVCLWAAYRSQYLSRQLKGLESYYRAFKTLLMMECPKPKGWEPEAYAEWVEGVACKKYSAIIGAQTLGARLASTKARDIFNAKAFLRLLNKFPFLKAAYLHSQTHPHFNSILQYSILIRGRGEAGFRSNGPVTGQPMDDFEALYCLRLPVNLFTKRGIIIGQGKPENHNSAVPFVVTELVQSNDMNMDAFLSEALKMRCLLHEMAQGDRVASLFPLQPSIEIVAHAGADYEDAIPSPQPQVMYLKHSAPGQQVVARLRELAGGPQLAIMGLASWIMTEKASPLAFCNSKFESLFTYNILRYMYYAGRVRYHYGYADVWNKYWAMTTTGLSRPVRNLNVVEDLTVGVRVALRGGVIKHRDYVMTGKGRETNLVGIFGYHRKIAAGVMEATYGRDFYRLHRQQDALRQVTSHLFIVAAFVSMRIVFSGILLRLWTELLLVLLDIPFLPSSLKTVPSLFLQLPNWFPVQMDEAGWYAGLFVWWMVGLVALFYGGEEALQHGLWAAVKLVVNMTLRGFFMFNIILLKIWEVYSMYATKFMAGVYVATGRGFGLHHVPFVLHFIMFARGFWYYATLLLGLAVVGNLNPRNVLHGNSLWSVFSSLYAPGALAGFLLLGPFWFTPMSFTLCKVMQDMREWLGWMWGVQHQATGTLWAAWQTAYVEPRMNLKGLVVDYWSTWVLGLLLSAAKNYVISLYCVQILNDWRNKPHIRTHPPSDILSIDRPSHHSSMSTEASALAARTAVFWAVLLSCLLLLRLLRRGPRTVYLTAGAIAHAVVIIAYTLAYWPYHDASNPLKHAFLTIVLNFCGLSFAGHLLMPLGRVLDIFKIMVDAIFWMFDYLLGVGVLAALFILSLIPPIPWLQNHLNMTNMGYPSFSCTS